MSACNKKRLIMDKKKTAGQLLLDEAKKLENKSMEMVSVIDLTNAMLKSDEFSKNMLNYIRQGKDAYHTDFYIIINMKKEALITMAGFQNVRTPPELKRNCPTPFYDQSVWKYHFKTEKLEYLWTIPDRDTCLYYRKFASQVVPEEQQLLNFVLQYYAGTLEQKAKELNGEKKGSPSVILTLHKE